MKNLVEFMGQTIDNSVWNFSDEQLAMAAEISASNPSIKWLTFDFNAPANTRTARRRGKFSFQYQPAPGANYVGFMMGVKKPLTAVPST